jgi:hypothetical protein
MKALFFIALAVLYTLFKVHLKRRGPKSRQLTDGERLNNLALKKGNSVYRIFHLAGESWSVAASKVEDDFQRYCTNEDIPHYVRDFVRRHADFRDIQHRARLFPGGDLPPSWSA